MTATDSTTLTRDLPDGSVLSFDDNGRSRVYRHHVIGQKPVRLTAVSTILGVLDKPALVRWSEACGAAGALAAVRLGELNPAIHADEEAIGVVRALKLGADAAKKKAADRGLTTHDALERYLRSEDLPNPADMDPEHRPYLKGLMRAMLALQPETEAVEQMTCHPEEGYAGRMDAIVRVGGRRVILDAKTNVRARGYPEAHVQCVLYAIAEQHLTGESFDGAIILGVGPDGTFNADEGCASREDALSVLATFKAMRRIRGEVDAWNRAARKAAA